MSGIPSINLRCKENCPFGLLCGKQVFEDNSECITNIQTTPQMPTGATLHASQNYSRDVTAKMGEKKVAEIKLGVAHFFN